MPVETKNVETLALHGGSYRSDPATGAVAVPIYQTTSFQFQDTDHARGCLRWNSSATSTPGSTIRHRMPSSNGSPRSKAARRRLRSPPGRPLRPSHIFNMAQAGDNIVSSTDLYGGTWALFVADAEAVRHRGALRRSCRSREFPPRHRREDPRLLRRDACPTRSSMCSRSRRSPTSAARSACR